MFHAHMLPTNNLLHRLLKARHHITTVRGSNNNLPGLISIFYQDISIHYVLYTVTQKLPLCSYISWNLL